MTASSSAGWPARRDSGRSPRPTGTRSARAARRGRRRGARDVRAEPTQPGASSRSAHGPRVRGVRLAPGRPRLHGHLARDPRLQRRGHAASPRPSAPGSRQRCWPAAPAAAQHAEPPPWSRSRATTRRRSTWTPPSTRSGLAPMRRTSRCSPATGSTAAAASDRYLRLGGIVAWCEEQPARRARPCGPTARPGSRCPSRPRVPAWRACAPTLADARRRVAGAGRAGGVTPAR
jgi:hypothetical protein